MIELNSTIHGIRSEIKYCKNNSENKSRTKIIGNKEKAEKSAKKLLYL